MAQFQLQNFSLIPVHKVHIGKMGKTGTFNGWGVMLLIHKEILHMPLTELENDSESIGAKVFAKKNFSLHSKLVSRTQWLVRRLSTPSKSARAH